MNAIKKARQIITAEPESQTALILARLVLALESDAEFSLSSIYTLDLESFDLAIDIMKEWRLDRYFTGKAKLLDVSLQARSMSAH